MVEPILKWAGGKRQILDTIVRRLPLERDFNDYYEPFFGGGAVFFKLEPDNGYINDINPRLMDFYRNVRDNPFEIIANNKKLDDEYKRLSEEGQKNFYYQRRDEFNSLRTDGECKDELQEASLLLFLNRTCWNGLYRTNQDGEFNVPQGSKWSRVSYLESRIIEASKVLGKANISQGNYTQIKDLVGEKDLVFFDPPYPAVSKTAKFEKYHKDGFSEEDQQQLWNLAKEFDRRGAHVLITNGMPAIEIYEASLPESFRIITVQGERRINSKSSRRTDIGNTEIIVTNCTPFQRQRTFDQFR